MSESTDHMNTTCKMTSGKTVSDYPESNCLKVNVIQYIIYSKLVAKKKILDHCQTSGMHFFVCVGEERLMTYSKSIVYKVVSQRSCF